MQDISSFVVLMLFATAACDENVTTIEVTTTSVPTTLSSTLSTSTTGSPSSTATPKLDNSTKLIQFPSNRTQFLNTTSYACSCDLTLNCDVNCCCDIDCNAEIIDAFDCSLGVEIDDFYHGEGLERCNGDNGFLCIAHDNIPSMDQKLRMPFYKEYSSYKWPKIIQTRESEPKYEFSSHDFYKFGDAVMTYDIKSEKYSPINVPAITIGDHSNCFLTEPVMFLKSKSIQCLRSYNELCLFNNNLMTQLMHSRLFQRPTKSSSSQEGSDSFNVVIESCKHSFDNCTQITVSNRSKIDEIQEYLYDEVFEDIQLTFLINDTKILSATIKFGCHNELICNNNDELEPTKIIQNIQIKFVNVNENRTERRIRKKRRGYNDNELIIASRLRPLNESITVPTSSTEMIFDFFRNDSAVDKSYFLKLPEVAGNGQCVMIDDKHDLLRFNENSHTYCTAKLTGDLNSNFTICQQFQHQLMNLLFSAANLTTNYTLDGYISDIFVSKFWTPQYDKNSWIRTSLHNMPLWSPEMQENDKIITCSNLVTAASYKFFYSTTKSSGVKKYEHSIENLIVAFDKLEELQFTLDDENQTTQNVDIEINVQFVNLFNKNRANAILVMNINAMILCILLASLASVL